MKLTAGARDSQLSITQSTQALKQLRRVLPWLTVELVPMTSPGDEDRKTDLRESPPDFFTRYLDDAVREGRVNMAIHSAKDLPYPTPEDIDWFWLPWHADRRDAVILRVGETMADLPANPVVGVSSDRRDEWAAKHVPNAIFRPIRGNIEHRLQQLDDGDFDVLLMAACALDRLNIPERITEYIPLSELESPEGQGYIAVTFRKGDAKMEALRQLLVPAVTLAGAGPGSVEHCSQGTIEALKNCDLCLYDALVDQRLLSLLPPGARAVDAGKRGGAYSLPREQLDQGLIDGCRQGRRIVRLKGGDPGIFGRLPQEIAALDARALPYRVLPGMSSLNAATTGTGILLTQRNESRGFTVTTPVLAAGAPGPVTAAERASHPLVFFMPVTRIRGIAEQLAADGRPTDEPAALVLGAGTRECEVISGTLTEIAESATSARIDDRPGLLIIGSIAAEANRIRVRRGLLSDQRILLTCSRDVMPGVVRRVHDFGGQPVEHSLIDLVPETKAVANLKRLSDYDWLVVTSPAAARCLLQLMREHGLDARALPRILTCGPGVERVLASAAIGIDARPDANFGADAMLEIAPEHLKSGDRVLRLRSDRASETVSRKLEEIGCIVDDVVLYHNQSVTPAPALPAFDAVFFASASAVDAFVEAYGNDACRHAAVVAIGKPTAKRLTAAGMSALTAYEATPVAAIETLAADHLGRLMSAAK
jgi:uroporphyrinogen III methyltransferase/synthase